MSFSIETEIIGGVMEGKGIKQFREYPHDKIVVVFRSRPHTITVMRYNDNGIPTIYEQDLKPGQRVTAKTFDPTQARQITELAPGEPYSFTTETKVRKTRYPTIVSITLTTNGNNLH